MNRVDEILILAERGIPQALARFNDGEVGIMFNKDFTAARGDQKGSIELQVSLLDSIKHKQENYWKGYPCPICMKKQRDQLHEAGLINLEYQWNTMAVVNTNRNLKHFIKQLPIALKGKQVIWVSGEDQNISMLNFNFVAHIKLPLKNAWELFSFAMEQCLKKAESYRVFIFSCGPTARVLVKNLFQLRPDCTFLDLGSTFDPVTRNVWHKCHTGKLKECSGCN